jgi:hypothetical protein
VGRSNDPEELKSMIEGRVGGGPNTPNSVTPGRA